MQALIPDSVIEAVLKGHDIVEVAGRHVTLTKRGRNYVGLCPFHSEKTPSFSVSPEKQIFKCFGCGKGGNVIHFVMEAEGLSYPEAVRQLAEELKIGWRWDGRPGESERQRELSRIVEAHELAAKWYHNILLHTDAGRPAMDYLKSRGFTLRLIETFGIGFAPPMRDKLSQFLSLRGFPLDLMAKGGLVRAQEEGGYADLFRGRIMFPIRDPEGRVVAFAGRLLGEGQPKYLNTPDAPQFNKSRMLYNLDQAKADIRRSGRVVLFEGYVDVIKAWEAGVNIGVASMGTSLTEQHGAVIRRFAREAVICYDGDDAGQAAALKSLALLEKQGLKVRVAVLPRGMDPDEYIARHGPEPFVHQVIDQPLSSVRFRLLRLQGEHQMQTEDGRLGYIRAALNVIAALQSPTEREHYIAELANEFGYAPETLRQECNEIREKLQKNRRMGGNNPVWWNNVMNNSGGAKASPALLPAYCNAERNLLAIMMHDPEITSYVEVKLGDAFNIEAHAALAAYIYAFYAEQSEPDIRKLLASMDSDLSGLASEISMLYSSEAVSEQAVDDYIREIQKVPVMRVIQQKKKEMAQAERANDLAHASQLGIEIIALERQLKSLHQEKF